MTLHLFINTKDYNYPLLCLLYAVNVKHSTNPCEYNNDDIINMQNIHLKVIKQMYYAIIMNKYA